MRLIWRGRSDDGLVAACKGMERYRAPLSRLGVPPPAAGALDALEAIGCTRRALKRGGYERGVEAIVHLVHADDMRVGPRVG